MSDDKAKTLAEALFDLWAEDTEEAMDMLHERGTMTGRDKAARTISHWYEMYRTPFDKLSPEDRATFEARARALLEILG